MISRVQFDHYGNVVCFIDGRDPNSIARDANASKPPGVARQPVGSAIAAPCAAGRQSFNLDACFEMVEPVEFGEVRA